jgi:hypothetical protein
LINGIRTRVPAALSRPCSATMGAELL